MNKIKKAVEILEKYNQSHIKVETEEIADQILKIWVKTHFYLYESLEITSWFKLNFIENPGMAFGIEVIGKLFRGFFTMVNIILYRRAFEEFLQFQVIPEDLADAMERILPGGERRAEVEADMKEMVEAISGGASGAVSRAASCVLAVVSERMEQERKTV